MEFEEAKTIAIQFVRDRFPDWPDLPARTIGTLLSRFWRVRGFETYRDALSHRLDGLPELAKFLRWLDRQPLDALATRPIVTTNVNELS